MNHNPLVKMITSNLDPSRHFMRSCPSTKPQNRDYQLNKRMKPFRAVWSLRLWKKCVTEVRTWPCICESLQLKNPKSTEYNTQRHIKKEHILKCMALARISMDQTKIRKPCKMKKCLIAQSAVGNCRLIIQETHICKKEHYFTNQ